MKTFVGIILIVFSSIFIHAQSALERKLFELNDVIFEKIETPKGFQSAYKLYVKQPLDHADYSKGFFYQKVYLSHRNIESPTVMITEGYERPTNRVYELTEMLNANQVQIEHRYYGESMPDSLDYSYLNMRNATHDFHKINFLLKSIYPDDWICTGISKGGQTTIFYRYFFPYDVEVSVPYVAPLNTSIEDKRIYQFLNKVGDQKCREKIISFQKKLLSQREECLAKLKWYVKGADLKFSYLTMEQAFEYAVLEYSFSFWQWGTKCEDIPNENSSNDVLLNHLIEVSGLSFFSDTDMKKYASHYYQAATELGYYGYEIAPFKELIKTLPNKTNPSAVFAPKEVNAPFDAILTNKVYKWVQEKGDEFIYIYGGNDTWTATGVSENKNRNAKWYVLEGKDHGQARIKNLSENQKSELLSTIQKWLKEKQ
ncbi:MAG: hypothetical protein RLZZ546_880 [Bacteroidota bacterium]|jgi:hypothetical protein